MMTGPLFTAQSYMAETRIPGSQANYKNGQLQKIARENTNQVFNFKFYEVLRIKIYNEGYETL